MNRRLSQRLDHGSCLHLVEAPDHAVRMIAIRGYNDTYDVKAAYGPSTLNTPQIFVLSYVYDLPFFKNERNLKGYVLGGWEISGIANIQTGQSLTVTQGTDPFAAVANNNSGINLAREGLIQIRANRSGNVNGPKTPAEFFNTGAFSRASGPSVTRRRVRCWAPGFSYGIRRCTRILILASGCACSSGLNRLTRSIMAVQTRSTPLVWDRRPIHSPARLGTPLSVPSRDITIRGRCSSG